MRAELVLLTLVVRADARQRGVGAALLGALIAAAAQRTRFGPVSLLLVVRTAHAAAF